MVSHTTHVSCETEWQQGHLSPLVYDYLLAKEFSAMHHASDIFLSLLEEMWIK